MCKPLTLSADAVLLDPVVHDVVIEVVEERLDVPGAIGAEVDEVRVLVDVERDERRGVPHRKRVLCVADVVEESSLVPVVRGPRPAARAHAGRLQVGRPAGDAAEVALDEIAEDATRIAAVAAEMLEIDLVVLDAADRECQIDLQRADLGVDLVRADEIDALELS